MTSSKPPDTMPFVILCAHHPRFNPTEPLHTAAALRSLLDLVTNPDCSHRPGSQSVSSSAEVRRC